LVEYLPLLWSLGSFEAINMALLTELLIGAINAQALRKFVLVIDL
jgi:hypothetical protein